MHSLWLILSSVFFGVAGVYCFIHPDMAMEAVALYIGFLVCFSGLSQLLRYGSTPAAARSQWQLVMAVLDVLFGGWLLLSGNYLLLVLFLPFMFAAYVLTRGLLLFVYYFRAKETVRSPHLFLLAAAVQVIFGGALAMMPLFAAAVFIYAVGAGLIWCGFTSFTLWRDVK